MDLQVSRQHGWHNKWSMAWKVFVCLCLLGGLWSGGAVRYASADVSGDYVYIVADGAVTITDYTGGKLPWQ